MHKISCSNVQDLMLRKPAGFKKIQVQERVYRMDQCSDSSIGEKNTEMETPMETVPIDRAETQEENDVEGDAKTETFEMKVLHRCFKRLEAKVDALSTNAAVKEDKQDEGFQSKSYCDEKMIQMEQKIEQDSKLSKKVCELEKEVQYSKIKMKLMAGTMQQMHQVIGDMTKKIENLEISTTKRYLTLSGLFVERNKKKMIAEIEAFISYELGIDVQVEDAYTMGTTEPPQIIFALQTLQEKHWILQNTKKLKNVKNQLEQPYYINDYYPTATNEKKRQERELIYRNNLREENNRAEITFQQGRTFIDGIEYLKSIHEPQPDEILDLSPDQYDNVLKFPLSKKAVLMEKSSEFHSYTTAVNSIEEIQKGYLKTRLLHTKARHVICAYHIDNGEIEEMDGCDDQEPGAARNVLQMMRQQGIKARAFYIARYCGKEKLGSKRFECYVEAAKMALIHQPKNTVLGVEQSFNKQMETTRKALSEQQVKLYAEIAAKKLQLHGKRGGRNRGRGGSYYNYRGGSKHLSATRRQLNKHSYTKNLGSNRKRGRSPGDADESQRKNSHTLCNSSQESLTSLKEDWGSTGTNGAWSEENDGQNIDCS